MTLSANAQEIEERAHGATNYEGLGKANMVDMAYTILTYASFVVDVCYAIASILVIYSATIIYIKINTGEEGFLKSVVTLVGSCIFLIAATIVFPGFFGFSTLGSPQLKGGFELPKFW